MGVGQATAISVLSVLLGLLVLGVVVTVLIIATKASKLEAAWKVALTQCKDPVMCTLSKDDTLTFNIDGSAYNPGLAKYALDLCTRSAMAFQARAPPALPPGTALIDTLNDASGLFGIVLRHESSGVYFCAFHGTLDGTQIRADVDYPQIGAGVSKGFYTQYESLKSSSSLKPCKEVLSAIPATAPLVITGHSLGAAVACIAAADLQRVANNNTYLYTFACPRVGTSAFAEYVAGSVVAAYTVLNTADVITELPFSVMSNVSDPANPFLFQHAGALQLFHAQTGCIQSNHMPPVYAKNLANTVRFIE
jgi:hypothetical protein